MQNNDQNKNTGLFFPGTPSRHGYLNFIERRRRFYLHQMFLMYVAHSNYEDFDTTEFDKIKLPPAQNVLGFAIEDIVGMDHIPTCFSPAPKPFTHLFFELSNGRRVYQYDINIELPAKNDDTCRMSRTLPF